MVLHHRSMSAPLACPQIVSSSSACRSESEGRRREIWVIWAPLAKCATAAVTSHNLCIVYKIRGIAPVGAALDSV